jgi:structural maintenance of chromosome 2
MQEIKFTGEQIGENSSNSITQIVEERKADMVQLKNGIAEVKARQAEARKNIERRGKDINAFSSNEDSRLADLDSSVDKLRKF